LQCTKCRCAAIFVNGDEKAESSRRRASLEHERIYERYSYHKRIGNAASDRFPAQSLAGLDGLNAARKSKGKAVGKVVVASVFVSKFASRTAKAVILSFIVAILAWSGAAQASTRHAAIVIDAKTGKTLYQSNADALRYPASLTKMMTLYLTFEAMRAGRISKSTPVPFSAEAASQPPTKLGVKAGGSITVETAIYSLITRSANDAATALGELLGGNTRNFARTMTATAHRLGMTRTTFKNANGLPDTEQVTTAHDMALLGIALREHFPQYYGYFATRSFKYGRHRIKGHNHLLGRIEGVDGIKTGYTRASGYNLATSVKRDGRSIVAVVLGGKTSRSRDAEMAELIRKYMPRASRQGDPGDYIASRQEVAGAAVAIALPRHDAPTPDKRPTRVVPAPSTQALALVSEAPEPAIRPALKVAEAIASKGVDPVSTASTAPSGWVIQVAATDSESQARAMLAKANSKAPTVLADASPFTAVYQKGGDTYYRARFAGFSSKAQAWDACGALKKRKIACYAVEQ
jgi:D-alanyl-D-alanine carboxypeptidase